MKPVAFNIAAVVLALGVFVGIPYAAVAEGYGYDPYKWRCVVDKQNDSMYSQSRSGYDFRGAQAGCTCQQIADYSRYVNKKYYGYSSIDHGAMRSDFGCKRYKDYR